MSYHIDDERKWRVSKSGFEIRVGWSDDKRVIAKYPGIAAGPDFNGKQFTEWLENAETICSLYNAQFASGAA